MSKSLERFERRILDEIHKMFNDSDSFYFSYSGDLTNSLQRQMSKTDGHGGDRVGVTAVLPGADRNSDVEVEPRWRRVDERFFFNKHLVQVR